MHKHILLENLKNYSCYDDSEKESLTATINFISSSQQFWNKQNSIGHLTVSSWVVSPDLRHFLLIHHKKLNTWLQIGGHVESCDVDIFSTAIRELREEAGVKNFKILSKDIYDIDKHLIPQRGTSELHYHFDIRLAFMISLDEELSINNEIKSIEWFPISDYPNILVNDSIVRMIKKMPSLDKYVSLQENLKDNSFK